MEIDVEGKTGIYIAYPTSPILKSIYRPKNYKTMVNDQHTKVGIAKDSFASRRKGYVGNFDNEVEFIPIAIVPLGDLIEAENLILGKICNEFTRVGRAREWFNTSEHQRIVEIVVSTLASSDFEHERIV
jgi:hypothetical protein